MNGWVSYSRYVLRPKSPADADALRDKENLNAVVPLDDYLCVTGLPFKMTPEMMLNVAYWAQNQDSYQEAEDSILRAYDIKVNDDTVRQVTNYIGNLVFERDCRFAESAFQKLCSGKMEFPKTKKRGVLYIETDGAAVNTRVKDANGSSWRENKLGMVFSSDNIHSWTDKHGDKQRQIQKREYTSYIGSVDEFKKHLFACALNNGYGLYEKTVLLSDGATWIRNMREEIFPDAQQILDYFHLCENVNDFAKYCFGMEESQHKSWASEICQLLKDSKWPHVLEILKKIKKPPQCTVDLYGYISNNANHIDYADYSSKGYFIGSGAIEGGNKSVLHQRLKQSGMRWNTATAQCLLSLRTKYKSGLWLRDVVIPTMRLLSPRRLPFPYNVTS
jgi:hypothetical protein